MTSSEIVFEFFLWKFHKIYIFWHKLPYFCTILHDFERKSIIFYNWNLENFFKMHTCTSFSRISNTKYFKYEIHYYIFKELYTVFSTLWTVTVDTVVTFKMKMKGKKNALFSDKIIQVIMRYDYLTIFKYQFSALLRHCWVTK